MGFGRGETNTHRLSRLRSADRTFAHTVQLTTVILPISTRHALTG